MFSFIVFSIKEKGAKAHFNLCFDSFVTFIVTKGVLKCKIYLCIFIKTIVICNSVACMSQKEHEKKYL